MSYISIYLIDGMNKECFCFCIPVSPYQPDISATSEHCQVIVITNTCFNGLARLEGKEGK
jgi:hypothetical protein